MSGREHGRRAGDQVLRVLAGESADQVPVDLSITARPMFDYVQLQRFQIPLTALPADSVVLNKPDSLWESHRILVLATLAALTILTALVLLLTFSVLRRRRAEQALSESETRYRILFQHANDAVFLADCGTHRIVDCNHKALELAGYTTEELRHMSVEELHPPEERTRVREIFERAAAGESCNEVSDLHCLRKDGGLVDIECNSVRLELGERAHQLIVVRNIAEKRRVEAEKAGLERQLVQAQNVIAHRGVLKEGIHFIQKPFTMRDVARKIREILGTAE